MSMSAGAGAARLERRDSEADGGAPPAQPDSTPAVPEAADATAASVAASRVGKSPAAAAVVSCCLRAARLLARWGLWRACKQNRGSAAVLAAALVVPLLPCEVRLQVTPTPRHLPARPPARCLQAACCCSACARARARLCCMASRRGH